MDSQFSEAWLKQAKKESQKYTVFKQSPWRHNLINIISLLFVLSLFAVANYLSFIAKIPVLIRFILVTYLYCISIFSLIVLVVHEGSHRMFLLFKSRIVQRRVEDILGSFFAGCFFVNYLSHWKKGHVVHHTSPLNYSDPQNCAQSIVDGPDLSKRILRLLFIPGYVLLLRHRCPENRSESSKLISMALGLSFFTLFVIYNIHLGNILNIVCFYFALIGASILNQCKICLEHGCQLARIDNYVFRSRSSIFWFRNLVLPFNISIHWEHHFNSAIPWYNLYRFHKELKTLVPVNYHRHIWNQGHKDVWLQLSGKKTLPEIVENEKAVAEVASAVL